MIPAITAVRSLVGALTFEEHFRREKAGPFPLRDFTAVYPDYKTHFYYGNPGGVDMTSRAYPGTMSVMLDGAFAPDVHPPNVQAPNGECLYIYAYPMSAAAAKKYGVGGRTYASGMFSTQGVFSQAYGYFEFSAKLPIISGAWTCGWLLPETKTAENGGRLAEIDIAECYGGPTTVISQGVPFVIDRAGRPFSTLHRGVIGDETATSNAQNLPPALTPGFHIYGLLWTPTEMHFYIDQVKTLSILDHGVSDRHYFILSMDVAQNAGVPDPAKYPAAMIVDYVRAWSLQ